MTPADIDVKRQAAYDASLVAQRLRREVFQIETAPSPTLLAELAAAEQALRQARESVRQLEGQMDLGWDIINTEAATGHLGSSTTGIASQATPRMSQVPTSIYHLFTRDDNPLVSVTVWNHSNDTRRICVTSQIEGYSARAIDTFEITAQGNHTLDQLPTLFIERVRDITELTRASVSVEIRDLDGAVEDHASRPIWLLARTTAPLAVKDPQTNQWRTMFNYLGAFVTPNVPDIMTYLRSAAYRHPDGRLVGYQGDPSAVQPQVKALFDALKQDSDITYVNSLIDFTPESGLSAQRVRLPRESLADKQANCIDGTVLFCSLLEAISLSPAIVLIPGHAFVAWETWKNSGQWKYLETTMIGTSTFEQACARAETTAQQYPNKTVLAVKDLRAQHGIWPME